MRKALCGLALLGCVLSAPEAHAQFANRSLGISPGFHGLFAPDVSWMIPATLTGSIYAESGFDIFIHIPVGFAGLKGRVPDPYLTLGWGGQVGARYLFLEESVRPWVGIQASVMFVLQDPDPLIFYGGLGASVGIDFFATDTFSIGPRAFFDGFLGVREGRATWRAQVGGNLNLSVYF